MVGYIRVTDDSILKILTVQKANRIEIYFDWYKLQQKNIIWKTDDIIFLIYAVIVLSLLQQNIIRRHYFSNLCGTFFSRLHYIMNYYKYIVLDAMDIFYVFYGILLLIKNFSGFVYLLFFKFVALEGRNYR